MAAMERVVIKLTREQKADVMQRAASERLSVSEYLRRELFEGEEEIRKLLDEMAASAERAIAAMDRTIRRGEESDRMRSTWEAEARARALEEFRDLNPRAYRRMIMQLEAGHVDAG